MKDARKFGLLASSSLLAVACVMVQTQVARADCTGDATSVVCSGTDSDGYDGSANTNQTITVNPDASVENTGDGIILGEGGNLTIEAGVSGVTADGQILITPTLGATGVAVLGNNGTVVNNGLIKVDTSSLLDEELASGIDILGTDADITNNGTIEILFSGADDNRAGIGITSVLGYATVNNTGDITIDNASGVLAEGINVLSNTSVTNSGTITITGGSGVDGSMVDPFDPMGPPIIIPAESSTRGMVVWGTDTTQVTNTGDITVSGNTSQPSRVVGVQIDDAGIFNNSGTITASNADVTSDSTGLLMSLDTATGSITNSGTITALYAIEVTPANFTFADITLLNSGALEGHVNLGDGNNDITNTVTGIIGAVDGSSNVTLASDLTTGSGDDTLNNAGRITGDVDLGDGTNTVTNSTGARIDGAVTLGAGNDTLTNAGTIIGDIDFGAGDDKVIIQDGAVFSGLLDGGAHTTGDTIELQGSATLIDVTYTGFEIILADCEDLDVNGYTSDTDLNLGATCNLINRGSFVAPNIIGGDGANTITNSGTISADIDLGGGDDRFVMIHDDDNPSSEAYLVDGSQSTIEGGAGTDTLELQGTGALGGFFFSTGPEPTGFEILEVKGDWTIYADMSFSGGTQLIGDGSTLSVIAGTLTSTVTGDDASNTLKNAGTITGAVDLGGGDDTLILYGSDLFSGTFGSTVTGGAGTDTLDLQGTNSTTPNSYDGSFTSFEKLTLTSSESEASAWTLTGTQAYSSGVFLNGPDAHLTNQGTLTANVTGDDSDNLLTNTGAITGNVNFGGGSDTLDNTGGTITGDVDFGAGDDILHGDKLGTVSGTVTLGTGDDTFVITGTSLGTIADVNASTQASNGTDTLLMSGDINSILAINAVTGFEKATVESAIWTLLGNQTFSGGVSLTDTGSIANWGGLTADVTGDANINLLTNAASGTLTGDVTLNGGDDGVWNLGTIAGSLDLGDDDDWLTNVGTITGDVLFGDGVDVLDNTGGTIEGKVDFGAGDDVFDAAKLGTVEGGVFMGAGDDTVNNSGTAIVNLDFGDGADMLNNSGTITGNVDFGAGADVVDTADLGTISGTITLGDGDDSLTNSITYAHDIDLGAGDDLFTNSGTFENDLYFGDGADTLDNTSGVINGDIYFGDGDDTLDLFKLGQVNGSIDLGAGDDTLRIEIENADFAGGLFSLFELAGGDGKDTIELAGFGTFEGSLDIDMEYLGLSGGTWTLAGEQTYEGVRLIGTGKLVNDGTLSTDVIGDDDANMMTNNATFTGDINLYGGEDTLVNSGNITGDVNFGDGDDTLNNSNGTITGNVNFGAGDDVQAAATLGEITGNVSLGTGDDVLVWNGTSFNVGSLSGGTDTDTVQLMETGTLAAGDVSDFEKLDVQGTLWTLTGAQTYTGGVVLGDSSDLTNSGQLTADITGGDLGNTLTNSGSITGTINLGDGSDSLDNTGGTITGTVDFGAGNDILNADKLGTITGDVLLGAGDDRLQVTSDSLAAAKAVLGSTEAEDGTDTLELLGTGTLAYNDFSGYEALALNNAEWSVTGLQFYLSGVSLLSSSELEVAALSGLVANVTGVSGNNSILINGNLNSSTVTLGSGDDSIENNGFFQAFLSQPRLAVNFGDGNNQLTNNGTITGDTTFGSGNDEVVNTGTINGFVNLGGGTNSLDNQKTLTGNITGGSGADTVTNSGTITGTVNLGSGANSLTNSGTLTGAVSGGAGNDEVSNSSTLVGDLTLGDGANRLENSGTITGALSTGNGGDVLTNSGTLTGNVDLGDGTNSFTNSSVIAGNVSGGSGADTLTNSGTITGTVDLGSGVNSLTNESTITGDVRLSGTNTLVNQSAITGNIHLAGSGSMTVAEQATVDGTIYVSDGATTITNNGTITGAAVTETITAAQLGLHTMLENNGSISGNITSRSSIVNNGEINGLITFSDDDNTLINDGTIYLTDGTIQMGYGKDKLVVSEKTVWDVPASAGYFSSTTPYVDGGIGGNNTLVANNSAGTSITIDMERFAHFEHFQMAGAGSVSMTARFSSENGWARLGFSTFTVKSGVFVLPARTYLTAAHALRIENGGTLKGHGIVIGAVWIDKGGSFAPGTSIGTFGIEGDLVMAEGSILEVEVIGPDVDQVIVDGTVTLGGTLEVISDFERGDNELGDTFEFITATGGFTGDFDEVTSDTPYFSTFTPAFTAEGIEVRLDRDSFMLAEMSAQHQAVAVELDTMAALADAGEASDQIVDFIEDMTWTPRSEAVSAFNQLVNQTAVRWATPTLRARQTFMGHVMDNAFGLMGIKDHDGRWAISGNLYGEWGTVDASSTAMGYAYNASGAMTSFDYRQADTSYGFALGGSRLGTGASGNGRTSLDMAAYVAHQAGNGMEFGASLGYALDYYDSSRRIQTTSQDLQLEASPGGHSVMANMHVRKQFTLAGSNITTLADLQYARLQRNAFEETGGGDLGLSIDDNTVTSLKSTLGLRLSREEGENAARFQPMVGLFWEHEFGDKERSTAAAFQALAGDGFAIYGVDMPTDQFRVEAGLMTRLWDRVTLDVTYSGTFAGNLRVSRGQATLRYSW